MAPSILLALLAMALLFVWLAIGDRLPGGRWFAVHLFTLGVLTNLILTFSEHFARTVTRTPGERAAGWPVVSNTGIVLILVGMPLGERWLVVVGATVLTGSVFAAYRRIRRIPRASVGARFVWVARLYERAHGEFVHGAVLGGLLAAGVLAGTGWYLGARLAHLHANVLGWGGLTLLATLVFFGPTMARTRIEDGADGRAARALRWGATGLGVGVLLLIPVGLPGWVGVTSRLAAAGALAVFAVAVTAVCLPVARVVATARSTGPRPLVLLVASVFPLVVWADVAVVASGAWRWLDAVGVAALAGVLAPAVLATLVYLAPMLRGGTSEARDVVRARLEVGARSRAGLLGIGIVGAVLGAARLDVGLPVARLGWTLLAGVVLATVATVLRPVPRS